MQVSLNEKRRERHSQREFVAFCAIQVTIGKRSRTCATKNIFFANVLVRMHQRSFVCFNKLRSTRKFDSHMNQYGASLTYLYSCDHYFLSLKMRIAASLLDPEGVTCKHKTLIEVYTEFLLLEEPVKFWKPEKGSSCIVVHPGLILFRKISNI